MKNRAVFTALFFLIVLAAILVRGARLDLRPMHHDEANQAVKFGLLLERGEYTYDLKDHHGPTLYYFTLPLAWISSGASFENLSETTLRLVPVLFGIGILLMLLVFKDGLGKTDKIFAGIIYAFSPVMVFFSRFFIQEMLLLFFMVGALASGWRYYCKPSSSWALVTGLFIGLMYATKETCVILFGSMAGALILIFFTDRRNFIKKEGAPPFSFRHFLLFMGAAMAVAFIFYSSFFENLPGPIDSLLAYQNYFDRAGSGGIHSHPWSYYLHMLAFFRSQPGPYWSEFFIIALALIGGAAGFLANQNKSKSILLNRFILFFTLISLAVYSAISYKTPWNLLPFHFGFILLSGMGAAFLIGLSKRLWVKTAVVLLLLLGMIHLGIQCCRANFVYYADPRNPYVYSQTTNDFLNLVQRVQDLSFIHPEGKNMFIKVVAAPTEYWPLPWYLRGFNQVGYWEDVKSAFDYPEAPILISSMDYAEEIESRLGDRFVSEYYGLRPGVLLSLYIDKDLWDEFIKTRTAK
ncbi:MAG: TIGR03663 family protein [Candidatus Aminicenantes bacterium]|nr:TIGR03663 family protein [Candidatus Aminicenantes bacterium]